jgi:pimeloyl-ACP methyl ester carboxylesterase
LKNKAKNSRLYGTCPFGVALVHGGPGASGEMAPLARELAAIRGIIEPLQTADTLDGQALELKKIIEGEGTPPVILIGFSWGAMLCVIMTTRYPSLVGRLVLISSAVYVDKYAVAIGKTRREKLSEAEKGEMDNLSVDSVEAMARLERLLYKVDAYDPLPYRQEIIDYRSEILQNVWREAAEMRSSGELLKLAGRITCPITAVHGDYDPHPYHGVKEPLERVLKDFRFVLLKNCSHRPWVERLARDEFYTIIKAEIAK